jgi:alkylhydroperoxidase/carboxymuconolactone decarboxylase family protein YurZ
MPDYLPRPYQNFVEQHPEVARAHEALGSACHAAGPLDKKTRHLIKLGLATAIESEGAVKSHARQALVAGAVPAELSHAVLLALTTSGFPRTVAALQWVQEVLDARQG